MLSLALHLDPVISLSQMAFHSKTPYSVSSISGKRLPMRKWSGHSSQLGRQEQRGEPLMAMHYPQHLTVPKCILPVVKWVRVYIRCLGCTRRHFTYQIALKAAKSTVRCVVPIAICSPQESRQYTPLFPA
ncbi:hypothetical protein SCLCIDRAFT_660249 [Scleroderma citrinum Foug A]|uniref:Uncharacterized protein n=1 Tax=Scleroderma citrinum Foug A TaxID=1036808 RepID=A0A0C2ZRK1_9AGAM|nr:hypothetical protein SCLCIDRAFT_660249 [Scleroderma citrinum Foug A]